MKEEFAMKKYVCDVCGWEYDEEVGYPEKGIAPGTKFQDLPEDFVVGDKVSVGTAGFIKTIVDVDLSRYMIKVNSIEDWIPMHKVCIVK